MIGPSKLVFREAHRVGRWSLFLLDLPNFPLAPPLCQELQQRLSPLVENLVQQKELEQDVFLQSWKLTPQAGSDLVSENLKLWSPELGCGVWPDRNPPDSWTETTMMDAAAASFRGDEPELPAHRLLHLETGKDERARAATLLRGLGVNLETFSRHGFGDIAAAAKTNFQKPIKDPRYAKSNFFLPLLSAATVTSRRFEQEGEQWLSGIDVYLRESAEDRALLLLSSIPLPSLSPAPPLT